MKQPKQYRIFMNRCDFCGCNQGTMQFVFIEPTDKRAAYQRGHIAHCFTCEKCGAETWFEAVPVISAVKCP
jgi:hypothetical protein